MSFKLAFAQYVSLLKTMLLNTLGLSINKNVEKVKGVKKIGKGGVIILTIFGFASILGYLVINSIELTKAAMASDMVKELHYGLIALAQISVLFFGLAGLINNLYFAKDAKTLSVLPFKEGVVFGAKFTMTYLAELLFAGIVYLPLATTSGIVLLKYGYSVSWTFFLVEIVNFLFIPAIPLLVATLISQPIMWLVSRLKNRTLGTTIGMALCYVAFFIIYFPMVMGISSVAEEGVLNGGIINVLVGLKQGTIFNYPLVEALLGNNCAVNLLIYLAGVTLILVVATGLSIVFFKRAVTLLGEGGGSFKAKVKKGENKANSLIKSFLVKDLRVMMGQPQLFLSIILVLILPIIVVFFLNSTFVEGPELEEGMNSQVFVVAIATYIISMMSCVGNPFGFVGFSLEGKNLFVLKTMPIAIKDLIKAKLYFASTLTLVSSIVILIAFPIVSGISNAVVIIGLPLLSLLSGVAFNSMALYNDLKKPNLTWTNVNELTRNNLKVMKPMLIAIGCSFLNMVIGIMLAVFSETFNLGDYAIYSIYYALCIIPPIIILSIYLKKLLNAEKEFECIGG